MIKLNFIRLIKALMLSSPFVAMILMVMALWGVGGKTTYIEHGALSQQMALKVGEAKNILVNETKSQKLSSTELDNPKVNAEEQDSPLNNTYSYEKINWDKVI